MMVIINICITLAFKKLLQTYMALVSPYPYIIVLLHTVVLAIGGREVFGALLVYLFFLSFNQCRWVPVMCQGRPGEPYG